MGLHKLDGEWKGGRMVGRKGEEGRTAEGNRMAGKGGITP